MKAKNLVQLLFFVFIYGLLIFFVTGCQDKSKFHYSPRIDTSNKYSSATIRFAIYPLYSPSWLFDVFNPLVTYLNSNVPGVTFVLVSSPDYPTFERRLSQGDFQFVLASPYHTVKARKQHYHVFGKMGDDDKLAGILLLRKDSPMQTLAELKGKRISYPDANSVAACMLLQYYLCEHGVSATKDVSSVFVGSQESSILSVYTRNTDAAATWLVPWQYFQKNYPKESQSLRVMFKTESLINHGLLVRDDVSSQLTKQVSAVLLNMDKTADGRKILNDIGISCFEAANNSTYDGVAQFINKFSAKVRPIE